MDENGLLSEIFETRKIGTTKCRLPWVISVNYQIAEKFTCLIQTRLRCTSKCAVLVFVSAP